MTNRESYIILQDIEGCGIVAGIIDPIGLLDIINDKLGTNPLEVVSPGIVGNAILDG